MRLFRRVRRGFGLCRTNEVELVGEGVVCKVGEGGMKYGFIT
jgi:hypothetical protein